MTRSTPFSYACGRCSHCCRNKGISLNPYEALRLARREGLTTTEFIARYTDRAGTLLKQRADGACVFLGTSGCGVHADRPLVCRIYPLARHLSPAREETFSELEPHPQTEGRYGTQGTVGDYLEAQAAEPFMQAADRYLNLFSELTDSLAERVERLAAPERAAVKEQFVSPAVDAQPALDWLDIDRTVDEYSRARGLAKPEHAKQLMELHVEALLALSRRFAEENAI
jgi:Fe-S-cluster containining protein